MRDLAVIVTALLAALDAQERHAHQPAPANDTRAYCATGWQLREDVRRLRREAAAALKRQEDAA